MNQKQWNSLKQNDVVKDDDNNIYVIILTTNEDFDQPLGLDFDFFASIINGHYKKTAPRYYTGICVTTNNLFRLYKPEVYKKVKNSKLIRLLYL